MKKYNNELERLTFIISLLSSDNYRDNDGNPTLTINKIHEITEIPKYILIKDVISLLENDFFSSHVHLYGNWEEYDNEEDEIESFKKSIISFRESSCEVPFFISEELFLNVLDDTEKHPILFDSLERNVISKILKKKYADNVWIKESPFSPPEKIIRLQDLIRISIENNNPISFSYVDSSGEKSSYEEYNAYRIFETIDEGVVYILSINPDNSLDLKRLDRMLFHKSLNDKKMPPCNEKAFERLDYMWAADGIGEDTPTKVTLLIEENTKNIISKIESETYRRKYGKLEKFSKKDKAFQKKYNKLIQKLIPDDHSEKAWIYTDEVLGINSFKRWLRKYGSSVLVLEPKELAIEMKESAERKLANYRDFTDFEC